MADMGAMTAIRNAPARTGHAASPRRSTRPRGDLSARISYQVATLAALIDRQSIRILAPHKLNLVEWRILTRTDAMGRCTLTDLLPSVAVDRALVSREIGRLRERGFIDVTADPDDGRRKFISLTPAGAECHARVLVDILKRQEGLAGQLTKAELETFANVVQKLKLALIARVGE
jgi:DNA-binding MarR family transcriptional regulator